MAETELRTDIAVIGGGPAGMAAAAAAREAGARDILVLEREPHLGGILNQCIHSGFGLHRFGEELTGPEYAARYEDKVRGLGIPCWLDTMALDIRPKKGRAAISAVNSAGVHEISAKAVVIATGCRERPRGALAIPGTRPAGIYTAGTAQKFVNIDGFMPGRNAVILGSGDIGLIMARRMALEGARVAAVVEMMPAPGGLKRNVAQCLEDFGIPLMLSHTVTEIAGMPRIEGVKVAAVGANGMPIMETERLIPCDTLLLSVGLIPENELSAKAGVAISPVTGGALVNESLQTSVDGIFACGNALHVHDLVDYVSEESAAAGRAAAQYAAGGGVRGVFDAVRVEAGSGIRYIVPAEISPARAGKKTVLRFRVTEARAGARVCVRIDGHAAHTEKKPALIPGEMVSVILDRDAFERHPFAKVLSVAVEP